MVAPLSAKTKFKMVADQSDCPELPMSAPDPIALELPHGVRFSSTGLAVPSPLTDDQWEEVAISLIKIEKGVQFALGDWWANRHKNYNSEDKDNFEKRFGYSRDSLNNLASVARSIHPSSRNENLSWSHHVAVAKLDPPDQSRCLNKAEGMKWSVRKLRDYIDKNYGSSEPDGVVTEAASAWHAELLERARSQTALLDMGAKQSERLRDLSDSALAELVDACEAATMCWREISNDVKRAARGATRERAADSESKRRPHRERLNAKPPADETPCRN